MTGPCFDQPVAEGGYAWWYVDALSDDGAHGLTVIAFVGSVFSPYYWYARHRGRSDPENYVAINVALYGNPRRWCMTERGRTSLRRTATRFEVGDSALEWSETGLTIHIEERSAPFFLPVRGTIRLTPKIVTAREFILDQHAHHVWRPIAPLARVEASFEAPSLSWSGEGYMDHNRGTRMLEDDFTSWNWSRGGTPLKTTVLYDIERKSGGAHALALTIDETGQFRDIEAPPVVRLPSASVWRMPRLTRCEGTYSPKIIRTLEDSPFYSRSLLQTQIEGKTVVGFHESLSLKALQRLIVKGMLPFRMPRRA